MATVRRRIPPMRAFAFPHSWPIGCDQAFTHITATRDCYFLLSVSFLSPVFWLRLHLRPSFFSACAPRQGCNGGIEGAKKQPMSGLLKGVEGGVVEGGRVGGTHAGGLQFKSHNFVSLFSFGVSSRIYNFSSTFLAACNGAKFRVSLSLSTSR